MEKNLLDVVKNSSGFTTIAYVIESNNDRLKPEKIDRIYNEKAHKGTRKYSSYEDALLSTAELKELEDGYEILLRSKLGKKNGEELKLGHAIYYAIVKRIGDNILLSGRTIARMNGELVLDREIDDLYSAKVHVPTRKVKIRR